MKIIVKSLLISIRYLTKCSRRAVNISGVKTYAVKYFGTQKYTMQLVSAFNSHYFSY
jgi:hypothetical protein